jgi:hypothetical protein
MPSHGNEHYDTLGISRTASVDEIRRAYRKLARQCHPDLNPGDKAAEERFKNVREAYDVLRDPKARRKYDEAHSYPARAAEPHPTPDFHPFEYERWREVEAALRAFYISVFSDKPPVSFTDGLKSFLMDAVIGLGAVTSALPAIAHLGGFNFYQPWMILPVPLFAAGFVFGHTPMNSWAKAARINTVTWCWLFFSGCAAEHLQWSDLLDAWPIVLMTYPPIVFGVFLRHLAGKPWGNRGR